MEIPQAQFLDKVYMSIVVSGAAGQTVQKTCGISTVAVLGQGLHPRRGRVWYRWPDSAENCGLSTVAVLGQGVHACFWSGADDQTVQKPVSSHRRSSLTRLTCPCVHDRCRVQPAVFSASSQVV